MAFWQHTSFSQLLDSTSTVDTAHHTSRNSAPIRTNTYGFYNTPHHTAPPTLSDIQIHSCIEYCITWSSSSAPASAARNSFHIHGIFEIVFSLIFFSVCYFRHSPPLPPSSPTPSSLVVHRTFVGVVHGLLICDRFSSPRPHGFLFRRNCERAKDANKSF